jgi:two-component system chemotaxis response regulator CheB
VTEPDDKEAIQSGHVYVAPSDYHLLIDDGRFALSTDPPVQHARPSIDVLFASAADAHANRTIGVILTGTNPDGAQGLAAIKQCGGLAVVQDPSTAEGQAMPAAAIDAGRIDHILPLRDIATLLVEFCLEKEG